MLIDFRIIAAGSAIIVGCLVAWANPGRRLNRAFLSFSIVVAAWLFSQWRAGVVESGLWWVRLACAWAVGVVLMMWFVKQTAAEPERTLTRHLRGMVPWIAIAAALIWICFTDYFVPETSTYERKQYGWGYLVYLVTLAGMVLAIFIQALLQARRLSGMRRLEVQLLLLGGSAAASAVIGLMVLGAMTGNSAFNRAQSVFVLAFYVGTSWAIVTTRLFDARYVLSVGLEKVVQLVLTAVVSWAIYVGFGLVVPDALALLFAVAGGLFVAAILERNIRRLLNLQRSDAEARTAAFAIARRETRPDQLERSFLKILEAWSKSERAIILRGDTAGLKGSGIELSSDHVVVQALRHLRWASPERLARERMTPERRVVDQFLRDNGLGLLVISDGPALSVLVGVGVPATRRPFTYPQVEQMIELASIIESALERSHFAVKVQHAEQLATVGLLGASLAHEIRNPLVSIKTFVQLLPSHHQDPVFRQKFFRLIGDEVGRIDQLTEQLLDLASPRAYAAESIELHAVLRASLDLVAAKAAHRNVQFFTSFGATPDLVFTDASAAKQVMLNLCFNAIQAAEMTADENRWVKIITRTVTAGVEMSVTDSGPGISPEIRPRLFQPFQTTKSSGFGLGLAICSDILANLNASITVDPPAHGQGATFRVIFPCQPSSS